MTDKAVQVAGDPREMTLLRAIGFDRLSPEQRELALSIAKRYELDPMLKHVVMVDGKPYITRDGLLHVAHRSGQLDGIETTEAAVSDGFWKATASVYRKDMSRPFTYVGRYPTSGGNQKFAPEMAVKVAEVMALRRAFDVAAPVAEERWDMPEAASASAAAPTLAERAAAKAAQVNASTGGTPDAAGAASPEPTAEPSAPGLARADFLAALQRHAISTEDAAAKATELFGQPTHLTDGQRFELLLALTGPEEAPSVPMFEEAAV